MSRQVAAVVVGVFVAVVVIYAVFDQRVTFRAPAGSSQVTQSQPPAN